MLLFFAGLLMVTLSACDPGQVLVIENKTTEKATVEFVFAGGHRPYDLEESSDSDTLLVALEAAQQSNSMKIYHFGIGTWEINHALDSLIMMVESVEIESWKSTELYNGETQIRNFFETRLSGRNKESIEIIIE